MPKAFIKTYGCQMNEKDSSQMQSLLTSAGYDRADDPFAADLILINTCAIRDKAVQKIYSELGRIRPLKEDRPELIVGIAGCVAEQDKERLTARFPFLDLVFGPDHIRQLPEMVADIAERRRGTSPAPLRAPLIKTGFDLRKDFQFVNVLPDAEEGSVKAFVNIQKGCDNICSFCIVPFVRGREVSRPQADIIAELKALQKRGVREVTLLGQNVNSYGLKTPGAPSFSRLLRLIFEETGLQRLRFTTSHPKDVKDDLIAEFRDNPILMPYFHLPVQSGSDRVLKDMRRQYSREDYTGIVSRLKRAVPDIRLSTDIIVGFPGESEADFSATLSLVDEIRFDQVFSFVYSQRPNTKAMDLPDDVPYAAKLDRLKILQTLTNNHSREANLAEVGKTREVLVETVDETADYPCMGRTPANKIVHFKGRDCHPGDFIPVRIERANSFCVYGATESGAVIAA